MKKIFIINIIFIFIFASSLLADKCDKCHKSEYDHFKTSVHNGQVECLECHTGADKEHSKGLQSGVDCLSCHDKMEGFKNTPHAKVMFNTSNKVYNCALCHTAHSILPSKNEFSSVNKKNLKDTCTKCHKDIKGKGFLGTFGNFRISAHEKIYAGEEYSDSNCLNCHHGNAAHGEKNLNPSNCDKCHNKDSFKFHTSKDINSAIWVFLAFLFLIGVSLYLTSQLYILLNKNSDNKDNDDKSE